MATTTAAAAAAAAPSPTVSSSARSSLDQNPSSTPTQARRKRTALRDYYNLGGPASSSTSTVSAAPETAAEPKSPSVLAPLDAAAFDPQGYVDGRLRSAGLAELMRTQAALTSETRGLDGERKGLVYDNYGRLIGARDVVQRVTRFLGSETQNATGTQDTARQADETTGESGQRAMAQVRQGVEALGPMVQGLTSAPGGASSASHPNQTEENQTQQDQAHQGKPQQQRQRDVVRWALASPARVRQLVAASQRPQAEQLWRRVEALLDGWSGVEGVEQLRRRGQAALGGGGGEEEEQ